ncbi:MAG TPA: hypothetical protein VJT50_00310 [Pyrinomonadaceae bacterium]|nr:hypothetical protein [Pyrinomonadaceae bacterium]
MSNFAWQSWITKSLLIVGMAIGCATLAAAQGSQRFSGAVDVHKFPTELNETFQLNIPERHINERNYDVATAVELATGDRNDLRVRVGVGLHADTIDVRLRNVTGTVRFRGSLQRIVDLLNVHLSSGPSR